MWTPEARAAALAARQANAQGKQQPGAAHQSGVRAAIGHAFATPLGKFGINLGKAFLGVAAGAAGTLIHSALRNQGGRGRR